MTDTLKFVIVGDGAIGKTSLLYVYANGSFPEDYIPTVQDDFTANETFKERSINLALWDTAGQEELKNIRKLSYQDTHVFLITFSAASHDSLVNCKIKWYPELAEHTKPGKPLIVMIGNKIDLRDEKPDAPENCTDEQMEQVRKDIGAAALVTCSAKKGIRVKDVFLKAIEVYYDSLDATKAGGGCCEIL